MKVLTARVPGSFEDGYLYMGHLVLLTTEKTVRFVPLMNLTEAIERQQPDAASVIELFFARNDWLTSPANRQLMANKAVAQAVDGTLSHFSDGGVTIEEALDGQEFDLGIDARVLLDLLIYNERIYVGCDNGLYHFEVSWDENVIQHYGSPVRRLDARSMFLAAGYGSVNISCGGEGLYSTFDEFGWLDHGTFGTPRRTAQRSARTGWLTSGVLNYEAASAPPVLFSASFERVEGEGLGVERERRVLTGLEVSESLRGLLAEAVSAAGTDLTSIEFLINSRNSLFIKVSDGSLLTATLRFKDGLSVAAVRSYPNLSGRVLSVQPTRLGMVIEEEERVVLFTHGEFWTLVDEAVLAVRTFPRSRRYKQLVLVVTEDGATLNALYEE